MSSGSLKSPANTDYVLNSPELNPTAAGASGNFLLIEDRIGLGMFQRQINKLSPLHTGIKPTELKGKAQKIGSTTLHHGISMEIEPQNHRTDEVGRDF